MITNKINNVTRLFSYFNRETTQNSELCTLLTAQSKYFVCVLSNRMRTINKLKCSVAFEKADIKKIAITIWRIKRKTLKKSIFINA